MNQGSQFRRLVVAIVCGGCLTQLELAGGAVGWAAEAAATPAAAPPPLALNTAQMLNDYFEQMSVAKPFRVRTGTAWETHRRQLQDFVLDCAGLKPLPERVPLDVHQSAPLDHPWCTVRRISYQLWPGVYSTGLLFMPKELRERPAPAMLCPHGHWSEGNANPEVQKRCFNLARLGYVTFSSTQNHYEDLYVGVSHQTLMIWNNIRALDYLDSLPEVDKTRIGVAGESGGGLQTQMLLAVDARPKAATIVGLTCNFRQIMFPAGSHCVCNHFPNVMQVTDHPEISTLGLPTAVQYLTMNDWTRTFETDAFPAIRQLYAAHHGGERVFCRYFDTDHNYDRTKREWTYWWMDRWLRGGVSESPTAEPETQTLPVETVQKLAADVPGHKGFAELTQIYRQTRGFRVPALASKAEWQAYRQTQTATLQKLLGEATQLPRTAKQISGAPQAQGDLLVERAAYPSEGPVAVPSIVVRPAAATGKLPVLVLLDASGKEQLLAQAGPNSPRALAGQGQLVVLPDLRITGELFATSAQPQGGQRQAWERNGIVWGRPVSGMAATDLRAVLDGLALRSDADLTKVTVRATRSGDLAIAALFATAQDARVGAADLDFQGACFENRKLPLVCSVLQHGDVLQWAALPADRNLTLRRLAPQAGKLAWLEQAFAAAGNAQGLKVVDN